MGDPKRQRKKYETPRFPWRSDQFNLELKLMGEYGLRNKRELWRIHTMLSGYRKAARALLAAPVEERVKPERELLDRLYRMGLVEQDALIEDVFDLNVEDVLARRLQTLVFRLGLARTPQQARQLIAHGHIAIGEQRFSSPAYLVKRGEEASINYASGSPITDGKHPLRASVSTPSTPGVPAPEKVKEG